LDLDEQVEDIMQDAVRANVWNIMEKLIEKSPVIAKEVHSGSLTLTGAVYSLTTGEVRTMEEEG
jgi:carbonic anhydrase